MQIYQAIVLGLIQGITELLPISSSAHLAIIPWILGWVNNLGFEEAFEAFDVALHGGTLLAIGIFFFKDWVNLLKATYNQVVHKEKTRESTMFWYLVMATIPGAIIGFILDKTLEIDSPIIIAIALIIMGVILYFVDKFSKSNIDYQNLKFKQTFLIGVSQALAFIPGVSRSGITMTTARGLGVEREAAAKYSFMLSAPIVLGATLYKFKDFVFNLSFFVGVFVSFISGILVIKFLLQYLKKGSFKGFAIYRIIFGITIIAINVIK
ncbi:MAG: undecaprenyl-diphosphate phosphatase [Clostridia bacterium]|nr:undecaprenyl-diphosphate phosphatase [Clostridia bacterium]